MPGWDGWIMRWLSSMLSNAFWVRSQPGTDIFVVLFVYCSVLLVAPPCYQEYSYIHVKEFTVWIVFSPLLYECIDHCYWFHCIAVWLQLHVSLVHISACSFAVSQTSDLAYLVGYVLYLLLLFIIILSYYLIYYSLMKLSNLCLKFISASNCIN